MLIIKKRNTMRKIMKKVLLLVLFFNLSPLCFAELNNTIDSLTTIDPHVMRFFPRWRVIEKNLAKNIYSAFITAGYKDQDLDIQNVQILAVEPDSADVEYNIILISCGPSSMKPIDFNLYMRDFKPILSGKTKKGPPKLNYQYEMIPYEEPPSPSQAEAVISYKEPKTDYVIILSLYEQILKVGSEGYWLRSSTGYDAIGYPFWSSGDSKITLKLPLVENIDSASRKYLPYVLSAYLGYGYNINSGLKPDIKGSLLGWIPDRRLNFSTGGKIIAGADFYLPFFTDIGLSFNLEIPLKSMQGEGIDTIKNFFEPIQMRPDVIDPTGTLTLTGVLPMLRSSGQLSFFYTYWFDKLKPENFIKINIGMNYNEILEYAMYETPENKFTTYRTLTREDNVEGLQYYKPNEFFDWLYFKIEYGNQSLKPFGFSVQFSNQILLGNIYIPIFGNWLYLEGKYATPIREIRPYEVKHFYMISPVLRFTL